MSKQNIPTPQPEDRDDEMKQRIFDGRIFQASISFKPTFRTSIFRFRRVRFAEAETHQFSSERT
jgi:hypothetical protein